MRKLVFSLCLISLEFLSAQPEDIHIDVYLFDTLTNSYGLTPSGYKEYVFDADSQLLRFESVEDGYGSRIEYKYDNGRWVSRITWNKVPGNSDWGLPTRTSLYQDEKGRDTLQWDEKMDQNLTWVPSFGNRTIYTEDQQGRVTNVRNETYFGSMGNTWIKSGGKDFIYLDGDTLPDEIWYYSDNSGNKINSRRMRCKSWGDVYKYELYPLPPLYFMDTWKDGQWKIQEFDSNLYYADSSIEYKYLWDEANSSFQFHSSRHTYYDTYGNFYLFFILVSGSNGLDTQSMTEYAISYKSPGKAESLIYSSYNSSKLYSRRKYIYSYSPINSIPKNEIIEINVYPNPVLIGGHLILKEGKAKKANLYSLEGRVYPLMILSDKNVMQLPALKPGIYLLHIEDEMGRMYTTKIQVQ